jgi:hypothetical protein
LDIYDVLKVPPWWLVGRPADFWFQHIDVIQSFVKEKKLQPMAAELLPFQGMASILTGNLPVQNVAAAAAPQQSETLAFRPPHFPGGIRVPHLHLGDKVYKLTPDQWREFSGGVMKGFAAKLSEAKTVSFSRLMELSTVVDSMS